MKVYCSHVVPLSVLVFVLIHQLHQPPSSASRSFSSLVRLSDLDCEENAADTLMTLLVKDQSLLANSEVAPCSTRFGGRRELHDPVECRRRPAHTRAVATVLGLPWSWFCWETFRFL